MRFALLGTLEVRDDEGRLVDVGGAQPRTALAMLLAAGGRGVSTDALIDALWGEAPPSSASATLQTYVSRLRRVLEPERRPRDPAKVLVSDTVGYRLEVEPESFDVARFEALAAAGAEALAASRPDEAAAALTEAEALWRGPALVEFRDAEFARGVATRLEERRLDVLEQRLEASLAVGRAAEVAAEAAEAVRVEPLRERRWAILALALYRSGRQADALRALDEARRTLGDELGIEPGRPLKELEAAILAHDPALDAVPAPTPVVAVGTDAPEPVGPPLVGRVAEWAVLQEVLAEGRRATRAVVVEGEPGIGKTRLLEALAAEAVGSGALALWGRTHESGAAPAYWPWLGALRTLVEQRPELAPALEPLLHPTADLGAIGEAGAATFRLHEAVASVLEAASARTPVVVLLDDLQWADPASLELLGYLTTRLTEAPLLLAASLRTLDVGRTDSVTATLATIARRPGTRRLVLRGLDEDGSGALLALAAGHPVPPDVAEAIHARSGGNPFFTGELARLLADEDLLGDAAAVAGAPVPAGVRDVLRRRLDRLPEPTLELARVAAVLGRDLELPLLATASGRPLDDCLDDLEPAVAQRLLIEAPGSPAAFRFVHALVREVLVEDMTSLRRARLHLRAADALLEGMGEHDDVAELVAEHLWAAVPLGVAERAAGALERAADVAVRRAALGAAEDLLRRALTLRQAAGDGPAAARAELSTVLTLLGVARSLHGYSAVRDLIERGQELADRLGERDLLVSLEWAEWAAADTACDAARADPIARRFRQRADEADVDDVVTRVLGDQVWGMHRWAHGDVGGAARHLDASLEGAERLPRRGYLPRMVAQQRLLVQAFSLHVHELIGDVDAPGPAYAALVRSSDDRFDRAMVLAFEACAAAAVGDVERSGRVGRAGLAADPDVSFSFWGSQNQIYAACAAADVGLFEEAHARALGSGTRTDLGLQFATMALVLAGVGRLDEARAYLRRAQDELVTYGERWPEPVIMLAEAELLAATDGPSEDVRALLERGAALAADQGAHAVAARLRRAGERLLGER